MEDFSDLNNTVKLYQESYNTDWAKSPRRVPFVGTVCLAVNECSCRSAKLGKV